MCGRPVCGAHVGRELPLGVIADVRRTQGWAEAALADCGFGKTLGEAVEVILNVVSPEHQTGEHDSEAVGVRVRATVRVRARDRRQFDVDAVDRVVRLCDPICTEVDCSRKMCSKGNVMLGTRSGTTNELVHQVQNITINLQRTETGEVKNYMSENTFALIFRTTLNETYKTTPIVFSLNRPENTAGAIEAALLALPARARLAGVSERGPSQEGP